MTDYTLTTTAEEDAALTWVAAKVDPPQDAATYLDARMHEVLFSYQQQYAVESALVHPEDVAVAYAKATTEQQEQVNAILEVTVPEA